MKIVVFISSFIYLLIHSENIVKSWICVKLLGALGTQQWIKSVKICTFVKLNSCKDYRGWTIDKTQSKTYGMSKSIDC